MFTLLIVPLAILTFWLPGVAIAHYFFSAWRLEEKLVYGFGFGLLIPLILVPLLLFFVPKLFYFFCLSIAILITVFALAYLIFEVRNIGFFVDQFSVMLIFIFLTFSLISYLFTELPIKWPDHLPDGAYIKKEKDNDVKIQILSGGLPIDNILPYVFSQYLIRGISFKDNSPILPGQPVSARTPLMSLVAAYVFGVIQNHPPEISILPKFKYVGSDWPDYRVLYEEPMFNKFLIVGIFLNASILFSVGILSRSLFGKSWATIILIFLSLSPMVLVNSFFTWPKLFSAFGFFLGIHAFLENRKPLLIAIFLSLSFYSHPMGGPFSLGFFLLIFYWNFQQKKPWKEVIPIPLYYAATVIPWFLWTTLGVDSHNNLFSQNWYDIPENWSIFLEFYTRIINYSRTFFPYGLSTSPPNFILYSLFSWPGAMGLILYFLGTTSIFLMFRFRLSIFICLIVIPFLIISLPFRKEHPGLGAYSSQFVVPLLMIGALVSMGLLPKYIRMFFCCFAFLELFGLLWLGFLPSGIELSSIFEGNAPLLFYLIVLLQTILILIGVYTLQVDKSEVFFENQFLKNKLII